MKCWWLFFHKFKICGEPVKQEFAGPNEYYAWFECCKCRRTKFLKCDREGVRQ